MARSEDKANESEKYFDCMAWLERVQAEIYEEIKDLSTEEELEYWRSSAERGPHGKWWQENYRCAGIVRERPLRSDRRSAKRS